MSPGALDRIAGNCSWLVLVTSSLGLLVLYVVCERVGSWYRLRHFKGPPLAAFSRVWLARSSTGGRLHLDLKEVNEKYGMLTNCVAGVGECTAC